MKSGAIVNIKVTGVWEWLLATIMGISLIELIAAKIRSHKQKRLNYPLKTLLSFKEVSSSIKLAASAASGGADT
jgi:hypothetical protein